MMLFCVAGVLVQVFLETNKGTHDEGELELRRSWTLAGLMAEAETRCEKDGMLGPQHALTAFVQIPGKDKKPLYTDAALSAAFTSAKKYADSNRDGQEQPRIILKRHFKPLQVPGLTVTAEVRMPRAAVSAGAEYLVSRGLGGQSTAAAAAEEQSRSNSSDPLAAAASGAAAVGGARAAAAAGAAADQVPAGTGGDAADAAAAEPTAEVCGSRGKGRTAGNFWRDAAAHQKADAAFKFGLITADNCAYTDVQVSCCRVCLLSSSLQP
jgi:hypothetical protein